MIKTIIFWMKSKNKILLRHHLQAVIFFIIQKIINLQSLRAFKI